MKVHIGIVDLTRLPAREAAALRALAALSRSDAERNYFDREGIRAFLDAVDEHRDRLERDVALAFGLTMTGAGIGVDLNRIDMILVNLEKVLENIADPDGQRINTDKPCMKQSLETFVMCWLYAMRYDSQEQAGINTITRSSFHLGTPDFAMDVAFTVVEPGMPLIPDARA